MNKCGDCTACCSVFAIPELKKPIHELCKNCTPKGCSIYQDRPKACKGFECAYITNNWALSLRPDISGVILTAFKGRKGFEALRIKDEVTPEIMSLIKSIKAQNNIIKGVDARK